MEGPHHIIGYMTLARLFAEAVNENAATLTGHPDSQRTEERIILIHTPFWLLSKTRKSSKEAAPRKFTSQPASNSMSINSRVRTLRIKRRSTRECDALGQIKP